VIPRTRNGRDATTGTSSSVKERQGSSTRSTYSARPHQLGLVHVESELAEAVGGGKSFEVGGQTWPSGGRVPSAVHGKGRGWGSGAKPPEADDIFVKICYFEPVLKYTYDYMNEFNYEIEEKSI